MSDENVAVPTADALETVTDDIEDLQLRVEELHEDAANGELSAIRADLAELRAAHDTIRADIKELVESRAAYVEPLESRLAEISAQIEALAKKPEPEPEPEPEDEPASVIEAVAEETPVATSEPQKRKRFFN